jgi:hypothetical protein
MAQPTIQPSVIETLARQRTDMVGSTFVTSAEVLLYVQAAWEELYMTLVSKHEDAFLVKATSPLTVGSSGGPYNLATDFLKLRGVRHQNKEFLRRIDLRETAGPTFNGQTGRPQFYTLEGGLTSAQPAATITVYPFGNVPYVLDYWYVPYLALEDVFVTSVYRVALWREFLVLAAAIKMKDKEESDCSVLIAEKTNLAMLIEKSFVPVDAGEPPSIISPGRDMPSIYGDPFLYEDYNG